MAIRDDDPDPERLPKDDGIIVVLLRNRGFTVERGTDLKVQVKRDECTGFASTVREAYREWYVAEAAKQP